jgi:hypothetical protein
VFEPEMAIEMQVKQSAVHVQQDGIDGAPVDHRISGWHRGGREA